MLKIKKINSNDISFSKNLQSHISKRKVNTSDIKEKVRMIISEVKSKRDTALVKYSKEYDNYDVQSANELEISKEECLEALKKISKEKLEALKFARSGIQEFSEHQKTKPWNYTSKGITLGEKITAIDKVGLYVPGGSAAYPSSVLMNSIPAKVAGVKEITMVFPSPKGKVNNMVLAAAYLGGVDRIFRIGGAHAVAALAFGTDTIPKVNMIVGPGS